MHMDHTIPLSKESETNTKITKVLLIRVKVLLYKYHEAKRRRVVQGVTLQTTPTLSFNGNNFILISLFDRAVFK